VLPFILTDLLRLVILIAFPIIALYLPSRMRGFDGLKFPQILPFPYWSWPGLTRPSRSGDAVPS
jgi:hypothetical protein